jgi:hypothetical protein
MASEQQVKTYLAYWFQLGKRVLIRNGQDSLQPQSVIAGDRYSTEFEQCWQTILSQESGDCYLEGTHQTIEELLSGNWELSSCARCLMPVPMVTVGMPPIECPCADLENWPDNQTVQPRSPISNQTQLLKIRERLRMS